jgi:carbamoyl-phosphate synthase small subunit
MLRTLVAKDCRVISLPITATAEEILQTNADGIVLSDGPGDPKANVQAIDAVKKLLGKKPMLGLGLGHQVMALATGADTKKNKHGHRGANQPVKCTADGRVYSSTQNHGYKVRKSSLKVGEISFVSVNDGSCEGISYPEHNALSVQFSPECCDIGNTINPIYEQFFAMMAKENEHA